MFLFFSPASFLSAALKKVALPIALLMFSFAAHAELSVKPEPAQQDAMVDVEQPPIQKRTNNHTRNTSFSHWPHHVQTSRSIIPPPPPGPYQSTALKDYSVNVPSSYRSSRPPAAMPMDMFSPDIPWPKNLRPERRMPEHYVSKQNQHYMQQGSMAQPPYSQYNYPSRQNVSPGGRVPGGMNMNSSRWMPAMDMAPPGPYNSRSYSNVTPNNPRNFVPNYSQNSNNAPSYGMNYGSPYGQPMMNNMAPNSAYPPYR